MRDYVHEHFAEHKTGKRPGSHDAMVVPHIVCADGTTLSVQASRTHYCAPREDTGPWSAVEVWCVTSPRGRSVAVPSFGDEPDEPYGWVPVAAVNRYIHRHGGLALHREQEA